MRIEAVSFFSPYDDGALLFDLDADPKQEHPIVDHEVERRMIRLLVQLMQANDAPGEQYERLGLPQDGNVTDAHLQLGREPDASGASDARYDRHTKLRALLADDRAREVLERHIPGLSSHPGMDMAKALSLAQFSAFARELVSDHALDEIERDLLRLAPATTAGKGAISP
jgi:hypothetical protein